MATIIDSLLITLGIDAKGVTTGAAAARAGVAGIGSGVTAAGKDVELAARRMTDGILRVRNEILGLMALISAGRGFKQLISDITGGDAAIGRLATNIEMNVRDLTAWQGAVQRAGGSAEGFAATAEGMTQAFQQFALTGQSSVVPYFRAMGVQMADAAGKMRPLEQILLDTTDAIQRQRLSPAQAQALGRGMGIDTGTINLLMQGRAAVERYLDEQRKLGVVSKEDAEKAQLLKNNLLDLRQGFDSLIRTVVNNFSPTIIRVMRTMVEWLEVNRGWLAQKIDEYLQRFITAIEGFDWNGKVEAVRGFAQAVDGVVQALGGWVRVTETLFAMWAITKVMGLVRGIATLGGALGLAGAGAGAAGGVVRGGGPVGLLAGLLGGAATAGGLLAAFGFDPRKLLPANLREAYGVGHPAPDEPSKGWSLSDPDLPPPIEGSLWNWLKGKFTGGPNLPPGSQVAAGNPLEGFNAAERMALYRRFIQYGEEESRAHKALLNQQSSLVNAGTPGNPSPAMVQGIDAVLGRGGAHQAGGASINKTLQAKEAYDFWISKGFTPAGAAGMVAGEQHESGFNPGARGDSGQAAGLFQWHPDRARKILNATGINVYTAGAQAQREAAYQEMALGLDPQSGAAFAHIKNATDARKAGAIHSLQVERPRDRMGNALTRGDTAQDWQNRFGGGNVVPMVPRVRPGDNIVRSPVDMRSSNSTSETNIGAIHVNTAATDANGIAADIDSALRRRSFAGQANTGLR